MNNILRLLKIDFLKFKNYRAFWVISILYSLLIISIPVAVMEFLKWLKEKGAEFEGFDPLKIPVLYFPDIWQNITYVFIFFKLFLAIIVIISISNEFSFKTVRQNIIDGMSRTEFALSKLTFIAALSLYSAVLVGLTGMATGLIYTPSLEGVNVFQGFSFMGAYFVDIFATLLIAFLLTLLIKRSGLSIAMFILIWPIEYIAAAYIPDSMDFMSEYFPLHAINNLIEFPYPKYIFREIQDWVSMESLFVVVLYIAGYIAFILRRLKTSDL